VVRVQARLFEARELLAASGIAVMETVVVIALDTQCLGYFAVTQASVF